MIRSLAWRYLDLISGDERVLCWCKVLPGILAVFYWTYQKIWVKKNGKIIYISSKIWRTFGYLMASLGQSAVVDAFDAARPIQDKSSCHRARDFTKVCCSGHESDSWANGQLFFFIVQLQGEIVIAAVLPLPAPPRLLSANSLSFCSTSKYSHRTPKKALSLSWASHTGESIPSWAHWKISSRCCDFTYVSVGSCARWLKLRMILKQMSSCRKRVWFMSVIDSPRFMSLWIKAIQGS